MLKNVARNFVMPCFIFELSTILNYWLMTSFCLQKVKKVYLADYVSKGELSQRTFFNRPFSYFENESGSKDTSLHFAEFSNVHNCDGSSYATQSSLAYKNV